MVCAATIDDVALKAAARYARRCWWADREDLEQEARVVALRAAQTWDPAVGVPFAPYAWRACVLSLRAYLWRQSSPVSETDHRLGDLRGVHAAPLSKAECIPSGDRADEALDRARARSKARRLIRLTVQRAAGPHAHLAAAVLLRKQRPRDVARDANVDVLVVYAATAKARNALRANAALARLYLEHL